MSSYLVISPSVGAPPRRVAIHDIARLFAGEEEQDAPAAPLLLRQRLAAAWQNAVTPLREIALLLREEQRARQREARGTAAAFLSLAP
ncbi:MAG: hypothetical protein ABSA13_05315 [Beijerinckiaceae bacterium]|jgi:hypothetical protein